MDQEILVEILVESRFNGRDLEVGVTVLLPQQLAREWIARGRARRGDTNASTQAGKEQPERAVRPPAKGAIEPGKGRKGKPERAIQPPSKLARKPAGAADGADSREAEHAT